MVGNESVREHFAQNSLFGAVLPKNEEVLNLLHIPLQFRGIVSIRLRFVAITWLREQ